jgi:hypothetical protein
VDQKKFELRVLLSLLNGYLMAGTTHDEVQSVVEHVHGKPLSELDAQTATDIAVDHVLSQAPSLQHAHELTAGSPPDKARYGKLIDLFRGKHVIRPLEVVEEATA